jgi:TRAP-type C4-dicarboxylate transport system permease small subunit
MQETDAQQHKIGRALTGLSRGFAVAGGLILTALTVMSVGSIAARVVVGKPLPGDFELLEMGCGIAVFAFLPYCHLKRGNVIVDFFTLKAPEGFKSLLDLLGNFIYLGIAVLLLWRMILGGLDRLESHESSMILAVPLWIGFVPISLSLLLLIAVLAVTAWRDAAHLLGARGR